MAGGIGLAEREGDGDGAVAVDGVGEDGAVLRDEELLVELDRLAGGVGALVGAQLYVGVSKHTLDYPLVEES